MKDLKTTWFLHHPIDSEHKQYLLLDFLKSVNEDIQRDNIYLPIKKIFSMIRELTLMKCLLEESAVIGQNLTKREKSILEYYENSLFTENEIEELEEIVEISLASLYRYADLGTSIWKTIEERIKSFEIPNVGTHDNFGILFLRNMATDEVYSYWWSHASNGRGVIMKKVNLLNNYYSISYEFLIHEVVQTIGLDLKECPRTIIMEIEEDFNKDSVILKIAKELFVREMEKPEAQNDSLY